jgi:hypothetical protein
VEKHIPVAVVISKAADGRPAAATEVKAAVNPAAVRVAARVVSDAILTIEKLRGEIHKR